MNQYDAVVIGAGNAGLTAATALQRGGSKTLLLERHNIPGGCATSFVRGEYEFEVALHQLSGLGTEERPFIMRKIFDKLGVMDKVEFVQEHQLFRDVCIHYQKMVQKLLLHHFFGFLHYLKIKIYGY